jgi:hypothetical protein
MEFGGEAGDVFTPPAPVPGNSCDTATLIDVGTLYTYTTPTAGTEQWWTFGVLAAGTYHVDVTGVIFALYPSNVFTGSGCPPSDSPAIFRTGCNQWTLASATHVWIQLTQSAGSGGTTYTFKVSTGPC